MTCANTLRFPNLKDCFLVCMFVIALEILVSILAFHFPDFHRTHMKRLLAQIPYCSAPFYDCFLNCFFVFKYLYCDTLVKMCTENKPQLEMHVK